MISYKWRGDIIVVLDIYRYLWVYVSIAVPKAISCHFEMVCHCGWDGLP